MRAARRMLHLGFEQHANDLKHGSVASVQSARQGVEGGLEATKSFRKSGSGG